MFGQIHHIEFYVSDLQKSVKFWSWLLRELDYKVYQKWEAGQSWKLQNTYVVLVQVEEKYLDNPYHRKRVGLNHVAFKVDKNFLRNIKQKIKRKKIKILYENKNYKNKIFFEDPDRIKVELAAY